jgi:hypothetical protein
MHDSLSAALRRLSINCQNRIAVQYKILTLLMRIVNRFFARPAFSPHFPLRLTVSLYYGKISPYFMEMEGYSGGVWSSFISSDEDRSAHRGDGFMPLLHVGCCLLLVYVPQQLFPHGH